jgi:Family of unknown function (DUF6076)
MEMSCEPGMPTTVRFDRTCTQVFEKATESLTDEYPVTAAGYAKEFSPFDALVGQLVTPTPGGVAVVDHARTLRVFVFGPGVEWLLPETGVGAVVSAADLLAAVGVLDTDDLTAIAAAVLGDPIRSVYRGAQPTEGSEGVPVVSFKALQPIVGETQERLVSLIGDRVRTRVDEFDIPSGRFVVTYVSEDLFALAALEIILRSQQGVTYKTCPLCSCPFIAVRGSHRVYCDRSAPGEAVGGRTCKAVGAMRRYRSKVEPDEMSATYTRHYQRRAKQAQRGSITADELEAWRIKARGFVERAALAGWSVEGLNEALKSLG